jgi:hypothetical protein
MTKIYYNNYLIFQVAGQYIVEMDNSYHASLISAKCHIDFLTR